MPLHLVGEIGHILVGADKRVNRADNHRVDPGSGATLGEPQVYNDVISKGRVSRRNILRLKHPRFVYESGQIEKSISPK